MDLFVSSDRLEKVAAACGYTIVSVACQAEFGQTRERSMWGRKEDQSDGTDIHPTSSQDSPQPKQAPPEPAPAPPKPVAPKPAAANSNSSRIGHSIKFSGEIRSDENFLVDGSVEGSISVPKHSVVIGPKSTVQATIEAHSVLIRGQVKGKINASERVEIAQTGRFEGDLVTRRLEIHDGAVFVGTSAVHGNKEPTKAPAPQPAAQPEKKAEAAPMRPPAKPAAPTLTPMPASPQRPAAKP